MDEAPEAGYRRRFLELVMAERPGSVLDVGCGDGAFLRDVTARGCRAVGVEVGEEAVAALARAGIAAHCARAESLPFADRAFDAVVMQFVPHHCADLGRALGEAMRVAARGVFILEGWYDASIPSQRVARDLERWSKAIDRRLGMIHADCPEAGDLLAALGRSDARAACTHDLILRDRSLDAVREAGETQLARIGGADERRKFDGILAAARRDGIGEGGALILALRKP